MHLETFAMHQLLFTLVRDLVLSGGGYTYKLAMHHFPVQARDRLRKHIIVTGLRKQFLETEWKKLACSGMNIVTNRYENVLVVCRTAKAFAISKHRNWDKTFS